MPGNIDNPSDRPFNSRTQHVELACYDREMDARIQSALLAGIVSLALALAMLLRRNRTRLWTTFAFLNLSLFLYRLGGFLLGVLAYEAVWPYRLTLAAAGFIAAAALEFLVAFQGDSGGRGGGLGRLPL